MTPRYDPLNAPIERARRNPDCEKARRDLDCLAHQPEPEFRWRDLFPLRVKLFIAGMAALIVVVAVLL